MLTISLAEYNRLHDAIADAARAIRTTHGGLPINGERYAVRAAALAALSSLSGDYVIIENEIHLVSPRFVATLQAKEG